MSSLLGSFRLSSSNHLYLPSPFFYFVYITECIIHQLIDVGTAGSTYIYVTMSRLPDYDIRMPVPIWISNSI